MSDVIIRILQAEIPPVKVLELTGDQLGGSDLASWRWNGLSLLHLAVDVKRGKLVKMLIEKGCDVNALDSSRWTPLTHACREGRLDIIKALVEQGAGVALAGAALVPVDSFTSLDVATQYGHMEILSYFHALAEKGGWLEWWYSGLRIVHVRAIENDHLHILKGIHAARSMKVTDPGFARSAIMSAIRLNRRAIAHYLLMDLQWDPRGLVEPHPELHVKEPAPYLCTLLHGAAMWCGDMDVMLALIWRGVDVNGPDSRGLVPLDYYVSDFRDEAALAFLMHCGAKWTSTRVYAEDLEALRREAGNVRVSGNPAASVLPAAAGSTSCAVAEYLPAPDWTIKYKAAVIELRQLVRRYIKASCRAPHDFGPLLCAARLHHGPVVSQATVDDIVYSFYTNYTHWSSEGGAKAGHPPLSMYPPFQCQLSKVGTVLRNPVVATDGCVYERTAIKAWIEECLTEDGVIVSPVTGAVMSTVLLPHMPSPCTKAAA